MKLGKTWGKLIVFICWLFESSRSPMYLLKSHSRLLVSFEILSEIWRVTFNKKKLCPCVHLLEFSEVTLHLTHAARLYKAQSKGFTSKSLCSHNQTISRQSSKEEQEAARWMLGSCVKCDFTTWHQALCVFPEYLGTWRDFSIGRHWSVPVAQFKLY